MRPALYVVDSPADGLLATMARPRGGDWLADELDALVGAGVDVLVCALTDDEFTELDLIAEPAAALLAGLDFIRYPIPDVTIPTDMAGVRRLAARLADEVRRGRFVVTHCRAGIGRSSMLAGATLVLLGVPPQDAWARIREARGLPVPDNREQEQWLYDFAATAGGQPDRGGRST